MFSQATKLIISKSLQRSLVNPQCERLLAANASRLFSTRILSSSMIDFSVGGQSPYHVPSMTFSSSSHDDFAPKRKVVEGEDEALSLIKEHIESNPIMLYMKGNPSMPMCKKQKKPVSLLYVL
jgi:hypothetical protein